MTMETLADIGEDRLVSQLIARMPRPEIGHLGPGDDCAVVDEGSPQLGLLKTDALVENIHFRSGEDPTRVGWKAIARVSSDMAAMGGTPDKFLITLALAPSTSLAWAQGLYDGMAKCLRAFGGVLVGGETCMIPEGSSAVISVAATGVVLRDQLVLRSTGRPGDALWVTGELGGTLAGKHLDFSPRLAEAAWLVRHFKPTAMMDLSDGLAQDLPRLAKSSGCGWQLDEARVPAAAGCTFSEAVGDGEDFELLFSAPADSSEALAKAWRAQFPTLALSRIGSLCETGAGGAQTEISANGWEHFSSHAQQPSTPHERS